MKIVIVAFLILPAFFSFRRARGGFLKTVTLIVRGGYSHFGTSSSRM